MPRVEVEVEWPCSPECCCDGKGTMPKVVTGTLASASDVAALEAGRTHLEMLWVAGWRHDSTAMYTSNKYALTDGEREWLKARAQSQEENNG